MALFLGPRTGRIFVKNPDEDFVPVPKDEQKEIKKETLHRIPLGEYWLRDVETHKYDILSLMNECESSKQLMPIWESRLKYLREFQFILWFLFKEVCAVHMKFKEAPFLCPSFEWITERLQKEPELASFLDWLLTLKEIKLVVKLLAVNPKLQITGQVLSNLNKFWVDTIHASNSELKKLNVCRARWNAMFYR